MSNGIANKTDAIWTRAKVGHKKTRDGCLKCRSRRVKCDEGRPECTNCLRLGLDCRFAPKFVAKSSGIPKTRQRRGRSVTAEPADNTNEQSSPESNNDPLSGVARSDSSRVDKRMELRLFHAFMNRANTQGQRSTNNPEWLAVWFGELPRLALDHDNLFYALLAFSATQMLGTVEETHDYEVARAEYWELALQRQREAVANNGNIEALTLSSILISLTCFGMLKDRDLDGMYEPPMEWLEVSKSAWIVGPAYEDLTDDSSVLKVASEMTRTIWQRGEDHNNQSVDEGYQAVLSRHLVEEIQQYGGSQTTTIKVYDDVLSWLSSLRKAVISEKEVHQRIKWVSLFAQIIPHDFIEYVRQTRPRALAVLAIFFDLAAQSKVLHVFGDPQNTIPSREIAAISNTLPEAWQDILSCTI